MLGRAKTAAPALIVRVQGQCFGGGVGMAGRSAMWRSGVDNAQ